MFGVIRILWNFLEDARLQIGALFFPDPSQF